MVFPKDTYLGRKEVSVGGAEKGSVLHKNGLWFLPRQFFPRRRERTLCTVATARSQNPCVTFQKPEFSRQRLSWRQWVKRCLKDRGPGARAHVELGGHQKVETANGNKRKKVRFWKEMHKCFCSRDRKAHSNQPKYWEPYLKPRCGDQH